MSSYLYDRQRRGLSLVTPPVVEPVSVEQAKKHLRLDADFMDDDDYVKSLIMVARGITEGYIRRAIIKQKWCLTMDRFPTWGDTDDPYFWLYRRGIIDLTVPPFMALDDFKWIDTNGAEKSLADAFPTAGMDPTAPLDQWITVDAQDDSVRLEPLYGQFWPVTQFRIKSVKISYWAGYTDGVPPNGIDPQDGDPAGKVPPEIKHAILMVVSNLYENREPVVVGQTVAELPLGYEALLSRYRSITF